MGNNLPFMLRKLRKEHKLTQAEIAKRLNIAQKTYSNYEIGTREPDLNTLIEIANIYKIGLDFLVGRYAQVAQQEPQERVKRTRRKSTECRCENVG